MSWPLKLQGRLVTESQVNDIRGLLEDYPSWNRSRLSRELCKRWQWQRPDGQMKDIACRELLRKLESRALITLPPRHRPGPGRPRDIEAIEIDQSLVPCALSEIKPVTIVNARDCGEHELIFNSLLNQHHYLSYQRTVGQNMKYLILGGNGRILGCLLFGAAAWKTAARDQWIGWSTTAREKNLGLLCNNTRFLIFDWVRVPHLASHALSACLRRLSQDWTARYGRNLC